MTYIRTRNTMTVQEAINEIHEGPKVIKITTPNGTGFIRKPTPTKYEVNIPLPFVFERHTLEDIDTATVIESIKDSDTAEIVPIEETPFSDE